MHLLLISLVQYQQLGCSFSHDNPWGMMYSCFVYECLVFPQQKNVPTLTFVYSNRQNQVSGYNRRTGNISDFDEAHNFQI